MSEYLPLWMLLAMFMLVFLGVHVAFALSGTALVCELSSSRLTNMRPFSST